MSPLFLFIVGCDATFSPGNFWQKAEKMIQASEDGSSSQPSSLRTEKSLQRQREWEIDHARVRAHKLREERLQEYQQETKVGNAYVHQRHSAAPSHLASKHVIQLRTTCPCFTI